MSRTRPHMDTSTDVAVTLHDDLHVRVMRQARRETTCAEEIIQKSIAFYLAHAEDLYLASQYARPARDEGEAS